MSVSKEAVTAIGTIAIAVGIGIAMQSTETAKLRYGPGAGEATSIEMGISASTAGETSMMGVKSIEFTSALPEARAVAPVTDIKADVPRHMPLETICRVEGSAENRPAAIVEISLNAPCLPDSELTVHHRGMLFTTKTDASGNAQILVPALARDAVFILAFGEGKGAVVKARVDDIQQYGRTVLQWRGKAGFELHAREFGASYGQNGHIWSGATQSLSGLIDGSNGYVQRLGDEKAQDPYLAEVYTYPIAHSNQDGLIDITIEAEVSKGNCGLDVTAQALEFNSDELQMRDVLLAVPGCDVAGSYIVLNNLVSDLKVAAR